ncbi:hypothetical protein M9Y10_021762 [Tritrichomonas musculus]|uniref:Protein kinase domain-containing protein n=1 Tax=Tritrichomonas musculus TaxID=1915356 RepID=A0ABR2KTL7_9EUKA
MCNIEISNEDFQSAYTKDDEILDEGYFAISSVHDQKGTHYLALKASQSDYYTKRTEEIKKLYSPDLFGNNPGFANLVRIVHDTKTNEDIFLLDNKSCQNGFLMKYLQNPRNEEYSTQNNTEIQAILIKLAKSILDAHTKSVVLRNVSISNVALDDNNNPVIISLLPACKNGDVAPILDLSPTLCPPEAKLIHNQNRQTNPNDLTLEIKPEQDVYVFGALMLMLSGGKFATIGFSLRTFAPPPKFLPVPPKHESEAVKKLITEMLSANPEDRPTIGTVFEKLKSGEVMLQDVDKAKLETLLNGFE